MNSGFYLTLMIGPVVPVAVSQEVLDALTSVSVTTNRQRERLPARIHTQQSLAAPDDFSSLERRVDSTG